MYPRSRLTRRAVTERLLRLCHRKQYGFEEIAFRGFYRLINLELGHAMQNSGRSGPVFHTSRP